MSNANDDRASATHPRTASVYLGLGIVACALGFAFLFSDDPRFGFKIGIALGQVMGASIVSLPFFLIWRFATNHGRSSSLPSAFNTFCSVLVTVWFLLFVVARNLLPSFVAGYEAGSASIPRPPAMSEGASKVPPAAPPEILPHHRRQWSSNMFDEFSSIQAIEEKARAIPQLNEQRAWAAVIAWQVYLMAARGEEANVALYMGVGQVLEGLRSSKGICRPGRLVTADAADANQDIPVGSQFVTSDCDR